MHDRHLRALRAAAALALAAAGAGHAAPREAALHLADGGKSAYSIYRDAGAPRTVDQAAREMQRVIRLATGAELPIVDQPRRPMIALGANAAAARAGLATDALPDDAFRIATIGPDLFILGKDTPDDYRWTTWASRGTLYGAFDFLERAVGVRWLMPGEWGEDVPRRDRLDVPALDVRETPAFAMRGLEYIQEKHDRMWTLRQKLTPPVAGRKLNQGHAWDDYIAAEVLAAHPEYLALRDGTRSKTGKGVKYCTTNPELVDLFAQGVIQWLDKNPGQRSASISASDGGGFCLCPRCQPLLTKDPHGRPSHTPALLDFYNEVARRVARRHPDRIVGALVYYNYMYPPEKPAKIEPNLYLVWAPLNYYGWGLAKPVYRAEFDRVMGGWAALTRNVEYHNYSTWMRSLNGAPVPPGLELLKLEVPAAKRHGLWGVMMVGQGAWGYGAVGNYVLAKQMWDAGVDVDAVYREWLQRAYGPGWEAMDRVYRMLEARFLERKRQESPQYRGEMYEVNYDLIEKIHLPLFAEMERLYREALAKAATEPQRKRLEMFGANLTMLHYNMRKAGMLNEPEKSSFYRSDEDYGKFLEACAASFALARNDQGKPYASPIWKGEWQGQ